MSNFTSNIKDDTYFWKEILEDKSSFISLSYDKSFGNIKGNNISFNRKVCKIPKDLITSILGNLKNEDNSSYICFLTIINILIYLYNNDQENITIGVLNSEKSDEIKLLNAQISGTQSFKECFYSIKNSSENLVVYTKLIDTFSNVLQHEKELLFKTLFVYGEENNICEKLNELQGVGIVILVSEGANDFKFQIYYDENLYEEATINAFINHTLECIYDINRFPNKKINEINLVTKEEKEMIINQWSGFNKEFCMDYSLIDIFEKRVKENPDNIAIVYMDEEITFKQLDIQCTKLACQLQKMGVKPNVNVGVFLERSINSVIAILAILKAGGVYVPMDFSYPKNYISLITNEADLKIIISQKNLASKIDINEQETFILFMDDINNFMEEIKLKKYWTLDYPALIMFTSGSTGTPKGVIHKQHQLLNFFQWMWFKYPFQPSDIIAQRCPLNFMPSMWELMGGLLKGITTIIIPDKVVKDPKALSMEIYDKDVTFIGIIPSLLNLMLDAEVDIKKYLSKLRVCLTVGEPMTLDLFNKYRARNISALLVCDYGSTETNGIIQFNSESKSSNREKLPYGKPIANVKIYILDGNLKLVPPGICGDIYVGGVAILQKYLRNDEYNTKKFIHNYFSDNKDEVLYKMGDIGKYHYDGTIEICGRKDQQVKIRGMRVDLNGVKDVINQFQGIKDNLLTIEQNKAKVKYIVAYIICNKGEKVKEDELRNFVSRRLLQHMIPSDFVFVDSYPRTASGKIDYNKLKLKKNNKRTKNNQVKNSIFYTEYDVKQLLTEIISDLIEKDVSSLSDEKVLSDLGVDSITAVNLINKLNEKFNLDLSVTILYDNFCIKDLSKYIFNKINNKSDEKQNNINFEGKEDITNSSKIAIIGISGMASGCKNLTEFWHNIKNGNSMIKEVPKFRWDIDRYYDSDSSKLGKSISKWGGFIDNIDEFDPLFFGITPKEAEVMDPQQRVFIEECWKAIEDSGYSPSELNSKMVGVFIGARSGDYNYKIEKSKSSNNVYALMGNDIAILAARISYILNLKGPNMALDTACSSSLVAIHQACNSILCGESKMAIAGGVCISTTHRRYVLDSKAGMLSPSGKCHTFDNDADGFVPGEGVGIVVLKSLEQAEKDGDHIYGVILASAMNQDGKTNGITAPSVNSQRDLEISVYEKGNINPRTIQYIEAHGTGTKLGDPIEVNALNESFGKWTKDKNFCAIGSVKTNIGHCIAASGVIGLIKILLAFKYKQIPPTINFKKSNEHIDFDNSPLYVNNRLRNWEQSNVPRRAAISSFGFSGTNCHMVLEEYSNKNITFVHDDAPYYMVIFSAKTKKSLQNKLNKILEWLNQNDNKYSIDEIAYNCFYGRSLFSIRKAFVVNSIEDLEVQLKSEINGKKAERCISHIFKCIDIKLQHAYRELGESLISDLEKYKLFEKNIYKDKLCTLTKLYIEGYAISMDKVFSKKPYRKISMPTYVFDNEKYWVFEDTEIGRENSKNLGNLIDADYSNGDKLQYLCRLSGEEFFVTDHIIGGKKVLPGVVYMEVARSIGELAIKKKVNKIKNIVWISPNYVTKSNLSFITKLKHSNEELQFKIGKEQDNGELECYCEGKMEFGLMEDINNNENYINLNQIKDRCKTVVDVSEFYDNFKKSNIDYGKSFRAIKKIVTNGSQSLAKIILPNNLEHQDNYYLNPAIFDGALQSVMSLIWENEEKVGVTYVPFSIGEFSLKSNLPKECYAYVTSSNKIRKGEKIFDILIIGEKGELIAEIKRFMLRPIHNSNEEVVYTTKLVKRNLVKKDYSLVNLDNVVVFGYDNEFFNAMMKKYNMRFLTLVKPGKVFKVLSENTYEINPESEEDYNLLIDELVKRKAFPDKIIHWWDVEYSDIDFIDFKENNYKVLYSLINISKALIKHRLNKIVKILHVYISEGKIKLYDNSVSGFAKSIFKENPHIICRTIELYNKPENFSQVADILLDEFLNDNKSLNRICYKNGERLVENIEKCNKTDKSFEDIKKNGVYIITGGIGGVGTIFAKHLGKIPGTKLVLCGRSQLTSYGSKKLEIIKELGAEVIYIQADVSKMRDVRLIVRQAKDKFGKITGVIHSAGVIHDSFLINKTKEEVNKILAPKIKGIYYLDQATQYEKLDFFIVFSSIAAIFGNIGQIDYAYANDFANNYINLREEKRIKNERFGRSVSINWPFWKYGGMKIKNEYIDLMYDSLGILPLDSKVGIKAFEEIIGFNKTKFIVLSGDKMKIENNIKKCNDNQERNDLFILDRKVDTNDDSSMLIDRTNHFLVGILSKITKIPSDKISVDEELESYGIDSIMIIDITKELEKYFGELSKTLFFEYQRLMELSQYFVENYRTELLKILNIKDKKTENIRVETQIENEIMPSEIEYSKKKVNNLKLRESIKDKEHSSLDIAVIGLGGRYPMAKDPDQLWRVLISGKDCITEIPKDHWDYDKYYEKRVDKNSKKYSKWGGFIDEWDQFDPLFFNIAPKEAILMDPQERLFLETTEQVLEDAGYTSEELKPYKVGVFVGAMWSQYQMYGANFQKDMDVPNSSFASIANRVSYIYDFHGPSLTIDTMCSSSVTAIKLACESILSGETDMAVAGGVNIVTHPNKYQQLSQGNFASSDGRCKSFGIDGDGYVPGDGVGAVLLRPLQEAIDNKDNIYAVIKAVTINHGGKTNGYTVPNPVAQAKLIEESLIKASINPRTISYVEAHGTGTSLGDPIEISALKKTYGKYTKDKQYCSIGSIKSNIGHLESAGGIAAITKVLLMMKHNMLVPSIHSKKLNPNINFSESPFYVQQELRKWKKPVIEEDGVKKVYPRRAGISAFGAGGSNAHLIIEEYDNRGNEINHHENAKPYIFILSAKTEEVLNRYASIMLRYLQKSDIENDDNKVLSLKNKISQEILDIVSRILHIDKEYLDLYEDMFEYGLSYTNVIEILRIIADKYRISVQARDFKDLSSINDIINYVIRNKMNLEEDELGEKTQIDNSANENKTQTDSLENIIYTLQVGRKSMNYRLAIVAYDENDLVFKLSKYINGDKNIENIFTGNEKSGNITIKSIFADSEGKDFIKILASHGKYGKIAQLWVSGVNFSWNILYQGEIMQKVSLPTYPFDRKRYFVKPFKNFIPQSNTELININNGLKDGESIPEAVIAVDKNMQGDTPNDKIENYVYKSIVLIWKEVIGVEDIDSETNFYDIGGDSVLAFRIIAAINQKYDLDISISTMLDYYIFGEFVDKVAEYIKEKKKNVKTKNKKVKSLIKVMERNEDGIYDVSKDQERFWFLSKLNDNSAMLNIPFAISIKGKFEKEILSKSFKIVLEENETLRTVFCVNKEGELKQKILSNMNNDIVFVSLENNNISKYSEETMKYLKNELEMKFDLAKGPLVKVVLLKLSSEEYILAGCINHIISDGWSVNNFVSQLLENYDLVATNKKVKSEEKEIQFIDYLYGENKNLPKVIENDLPYWSKKLANIEEKMLLFPDFERPAQLSHKGEQVFFNIEPEIYNKLLNISKEKHVSLNIILISVFKTLLYLVSGENEIVIGTPVTDRDDIATENMIGLISNTLVLCSNINNNMRFEEVINEVRKTLYEAYDHKKVPFSYIVDSIKKQKSLKYNPFFQVMFNIIPGARYNSSSNIQYKNLDYNSMNIDYDLFMIMTEKKNLGLHGFLAYSTDLYKKETIEYFVKGYCDILKQIVDNLDMQLLNMELSKDIIAKRKEYDKNNVKYNLAIAASFTAEPLTESLNYWMKQLNLSNKLTFAPYNQIFQMLLQNNELFYTNTYGVNIILLRFDDWIRYDNESTYEEKEHKLRQNLNDFINVLTSAAQKVTQPILFYLLPNNNKERKQYDNLYEDLEKNLSSGINKISNVYYYNWKSIDYYYKSKNIYDENSDKQGHVPFTAEYYTIISTHIARVIYSLKYPQSKVIVLDCDNTLWKGVCGEDGIDGIKLDNARIQFHKFLLEQKKAGMLLCMCSKNEERDVLEVFKNRSDFPLKLSDFVSWKINWKNKSQNLIELASELQLGIDSFIFIDDNPIECAEVKTNLSSVVTLQFPQEEEKIDAIIKHTWAFDHLVRTSEDANRTIMYQQNLQREKEKESSVSFKDFLKNIKLNITLSRMKEKDLERVSQLTFRTNQFNSTKIQRTTHDIMSFVRNSMNECLTVHVKDRFGDYGLVGVVFFRRQEQNFIVDSMILSCRVLGKGVEHYIVAQLGKIARESGISEIVFQYNTTDKNTPIRDFFNQFKGCKMEQKEDNGFNYIVNTDFAENLRFEPQEIKAEASNKSNNMKYTKSSVNTGVKNLISEIPVKLYTPQLILEDLKLNLPKQELKKIKKSKYVAPKNEVERKVADIWKKVLGIDKVGLNDNFFDLGGSSLMLVNISSMLKTYLNREVPIVKLFQYSTVLSLCNYLSGKLKSNAKDKKRGLSQREILMKLNR